MERLFHHVFDIEDTRRIIARAPLDVPARKIQQEARSLLRGWHDVSWSVDSSPDATDASMRVRTLTVNFGSHASLVQSDVVEKLRSLTA